MSGYLDYSGRDDVLSGGSRMIPVNTPAGQFRVWVKRVGNNPSLRVLLLHGGPGATHESFEACDSYLPAAGIEYYYYDQLGSGYSDQPDEPSLWDLDRFVDEVEQVRQALGLERDNFVLLGHSWGGILAIEYSLHHQQHLRGLVISSMISSVPAYNDYAEQVLMPQMDQAVLAEIKAFEARGETDNPKYMELLMEHHYVHHVLRLRRRTGRTRCSARSRASTRPSTCPCRAPANWVSAPTPAWPTGTGPVNWPRSTCRPW